MINQKFVSKQERKVLFLVSLVVMAALTACQSDRKQEIMQKPGEQLETEKIVEQNNQPFVQWHYNPRNLDISAYFKSGEYGSAVYIRDGQKDIYKLPISESAQPVLSFQEAELGGFACIILDSCLGGIHTVTVLALSDDAQGSASVLDCGSLSDGVTRARLDLAQGQNVLIFEQAVGGLSGAQNATVPLVCTLRKNVGQKPALYLQMCSQDAEPPQIIDWHTVIASSDSLSLSTARSGQEGEEPVRDSGWLSDAPPSSSGLQAAPVELTEYLARLVFNGQGRKVPERLKKLWPKSRPGRLLYQKALHEALTKMSFYEQIETSLKGW